MDKEKKVFVVGGGAREHALLWKLGQSPQVGKMYCAPGNAGTAEIAENLPIAADNIDELLAVAKDKNIDLTVVGPEAALAKAIVNDFNEAGKTIFGPTQEAARLESSKIWAVRFMQKYNIPHFRSEIPDDYDHALFLANTLPFQYVIKEDGLAGGKGVIVPDNKDEATAIVARFIVQEKTFFLQQRGSGPEVSLLALTDGSDYKLFPPAQDHKRLYDGDKGPNTGGMGAYAPVPEDILSRKTLRSIERDIIKPTIAGMKDQGITYKGVLYAGIMLTEDGPKVLEFNCRFGDPETQPMMMLMQSDLYPVLHGSAVGDLSQEHMSFRNGASMCVVYASEGYPQKAKTGDMIYGLDTIPDPDIQIFHAATARNKNGEVVTTGGRVIGVTAFGKTLEEARDKIDSQGIYFRGMQRRHDIGTSVIR